MVIHQQSRPEPLIRPGNLLLALHYGTAPHRPVNGHTRALSVVAQVVFQYSERFIERIRHRYQMVEIRSKAYALNERNV
jgi:hypothetical protein